MKLIRNFTFEGGSSNLEENSDYYIDPQQFFLSRIVKILLD